jgi:levanbiose-producing levanase
MNNWTYARKLPTSDWQGGADSLVRDIRLKTVGGKPSLVSTPAEALSALEGTPQAVADRRITQNGIVQDGTADLPVPANGAYRLDVAFERRPDDDGTEALLKLGSGGADFAAIGYNFKDETAFVARAAVVPGVEPLGPVFTDRRTASSPPRGGQAQGRGTVELTVFVDYSSVEVFVNGGEQSFTSLVFPRDGQHTVTAATAGGSMALKSFTYRPMATAG